MYEVKIVCNITDKRPYGEPIPYSPPRIFNNENDAVAAAKACFLYNQFAHMVTGPNFCYCTARPYGV